MSDQKERQIPFTKEMFEAVQRFADEDRRAFKNQTAILIEEAISARNEKAAAKNGA